MSDSPEPGEDVYTDEMAVEDLTRFVAAVTSGMKGAIPESEDQDLAHQIVELINTRYDDDDVDDFEVTAMFDNGLVEVHRKSTDEFRQYKIGDLIKLAGNWDTAQHTDKKEKD